MTAQIFAYAVVPLVAVGFGVVGLAIVRATRPARSPKPDAYRRYPQA